MKRPFRPGAVIIGEVLAVLSRDRIRYTPTPKVTLFLATAVSAEADYLVMGDRKLQDLGAYEGVTIASPRQFLERFSGMRRT
jgi:predicted nucleic acid-binding protein